MSEKRVYKYGVLSDAVVVSEGVWQTHVVMPEGEVLSAGFQVDDLVMWALVDPDGPVESRTFIIAWTGQPIVDDVGAEFTGLKFLATVQAGRLVYHVFERIGGIG